MIELPETLLIDGATGTELDRAGVDIALPLWSARAIVEAPDVLQRVHEAYLRAGAQAVTTATFRTSRRTLARVGWGDRAAELTRKAVEIARAACTRARPEALVLGSVAPLEECYEPDRTPPPDVCADEHEWMIRDLLDGGVDLILIETIATIREAGAAAGVARRLAPGRWMIGCCTRADGPPGVLLSGERLLDALPALHDALAVGVNCVAAPSIEPQLRVLGQALPAPARVLAYGNVGYPDKMGNWVITDAIDPEAYAAYAARWLETGASIVGGCCGTTPETIAAVGRTLARNTSD
ncbi:MAG: homocysteine S-methyltransferase family protein [Planctomycetota bacterium]